MSGVAGVASQDEELAVVDDGGVSPALTWVVGLPGLKNPLQLFKLTTVLVALHATYLKFLLICTFNFPVLCPSIASPAPSFVPSHPFIPPRPSPSKLTFERGVIVLGDPSTMLHTTVSDLTDSQKFISSERSKKHSKTKTHKNDGKALKMVSMFE